MLLLGQTGQERFLGQQFQQPFAQPGAFGGQRELFGTAVGGVGTPFDQPLAFEFVDHDGGVRRFVGHSPVQITHPLWENTFDFDHQKSTSLRSSLLAELAKPDTIGYGIHFADVPFGRVDLDGDLPAWRPVDA